MKIDYTVELALQDANRINIDLLDAELLLAHTLKISRTNIISRPERILTGAEAEVYKGLIERRSRHEPIAYLLGTKEFWSLDFIITSDVLIPRPETECLVQELLEQIPIDKSLDILEMATGSGVIACALASERPKVNITATDKSKKALAIAKHNVENQGHKNIKLVHSDWFSSLGKSKFDIIVANPPYLAESDHHLQKDLLFEPKRALVAGKTGMEAYNAILDKVQKHLNSSGMIIFEHGFDQDITLKSLLKERGFLGIVSKLDYAGMPRMTIARTL